MLLNPRPWMPWHWSVSFRPAVFPGCYTLGCCLIRVALGAQCLQITQCVIVTGRNVIYVPGAPSAARTANSAAVASIPKYSAAARFPVSGQSLFPSRSRELTTHRYSLNPYIYRPLCLVGSVVFDYLGSVVALARSEAR